MIKELTKCGVIPGLLEYIVWNVYCPTEGRLEQKISYSGKMDIEASM